jgi:hypothetical protein
MSLDKLIGTQILVHNNTPVNDFLGLTRTQVHKLISEPFGEGSPVQLRNDIDNDVLDQIPLFRILEEYLNIIQRDKQIKLTPLGALPKKIITELYEKKFLPDVHVDSGVTRLWKEDDCISIRTTRMVAEVSGLVKKLNGEVVLTKAATKFLEDGNRQKIFRQFFKAFTVKFHWGFNDRFTHRETGQMAWAFSVYMLYKFGSEARTVDFYSAMYLTAFPTLIQHFQNSYITAEQQFVHCYGVRTIDRFLRWFGFVAVEIKGNYFNFNHDTFKESDILKKVFMVKD